MSSWQNYLQTNQERFIEELKDFIRIPSISALSEHKADVERAGAIKSDKGVAGVGPG